MQKIAVIKMLLIHDEIPVENIMKRTLKFPDSIVNTACVVILFLLIVLALPLFPGLPYDMLCWRVWTNHIMQKGVGSAYEGGSNYMPLYHYFLWIYGSLAGSASSISSHLPYLRIITVLFDFWGLWLVYKWGKLKLAYAALMVISVLNLSYYYNSVIWGQVDGIVATLVFAMLFAGWKRDLIFSGVACVLAVNMKLQAVAFLPVWIILVIDVLIARGGLKKVGAMFIVMTITQIALLIPYALTKGGLVSVWNTITNATETFPVVSKNAFNFWSWFVEEPDLTLDSLPAINNLSYRNAGFMLFFVGLFCVLLPMMRILFMRIKERAEDQIPFPKELIWLTSSLVGLLFFFFNTQMHERYSHTAFIFITAYAFSKRSYIPYILFSVAYFLNLDSVIEFFLKDTSQPYFVREGSSVIMTADKAPFYFRGDYIAILFAATIIYLYVMLIREGQVLPTNAVTQTEPSHSSPQKSVEKARKSSPGNIKKKQQ